MANYATLKAAIAAAIKQNGNNEITGNLLQQQLLAMVNSLGAGYQYIGIATIATNPGTPDQNVFYLASTAGTYTNFGGLVLADGEIAILKYNGAWSKDSTGAASSEKLNQLDQEVNRTIQSGVWNKISFFLNSLYNNLTGVITETIGWASTERTILLANSVYTFSKDNILEYKLYSLNVWDNNGNFLGAEPFPLGGSYYVITSAKIKSLYPTAAYVAFNIWGGASHPALTDEDIADWELSLVADGEMVEQIKKLTDEVAQNNSDIINIQTELDDVKEELGRNTLDFTLNKLINQYGETVETNGFACSNKVVLNEGDEFVFTPNNIGYYLWWALVWDSENTFLGNIDCHENYKYGISVNEIKTEYPTAYFVSFDTWGGSRHPALIPSDIEDWKLEQLISGGLVERVAKLENESLDRPNYLHCDMSPDALSWIVSPFNNVANIKVTFKMKRASNLNTNPVFNFENLFLVNKSTGVETLIHSLEDEINPAFFNSSAIGANHGDSDLRKLTVPGHGKTAVDIGSIWTDGTSQCTLVGVEDENNLLFIGQNTVQYPKFTFRTNMFSSGVTLTHVSGAAHQQNITISSVTSKQWKSAMPSADISIFIDDKNIANSGEYYFNTLKICESYDVVNYASVVDKIQQAVGTFDETPNPNSLGADKVARYSILYQFDNAGEWRMAHNFTAYQDIILDWYGFTQQYPLEGSNVLMYIPKVKPISDGQTTRDFRTIEQYNSVAQPMYVTREYWEDSNLPPDRWLQISANIVLHSGYLFDYGVGGNNRKDFINNAFYIYTTRKCYPYGIDDKITVSAGDTFSAVVWRTYIDRNNISLNGMIASNVFEYAGDCYIYADFNAPGLYKIEIPSKFVGRKIEVFEKRDNVEMLTQISNTEVLVKVTDGTPMYGYIVAKIQG